MSSKLIGKMSFTKSWNNFSVSGFEVIAQEGIFSHLIVKKHAYIEVMWMKLTAVRCIEYRYMFKDYNTLLFKVTT